MNTQLAPSQTVMSKSLIAPTGLSIPLTRLDRGHIAIYGQTESGKTRYAKALIKHVIKPDYLYVFLGSPDDSWSKLDFANKTIFDSWDHIDEVIKSTTERVATNKAIRTVIVLDDFNEKINTATDKKYTMLFTQTRHVNISVINMSQTATGLGPGARGNVKYVAMTHINTINMLTALAANYLNNNVTKLNSAMDSIKKTRNVLFLDVKNSEVYIDNAMNYPNVDEQPDFNQIAGTDGPTGANLSNTINAGVTDNRRIQNAGLYHEQNTINLHTQVAINQKLEDNRINNQIMLENYRNQRRMKIIAEKDELFDLLQRYKLTHEDRKRCINLLKVFCKRSDIDDSNYEKFAERWMAHYFPDYKYQRTGAHYIMNHLDLVTNTNKENVSEFVISNAKNIAKNNNSGLLNKVIKHTGIKYLLE